MSTVRSRAIPRRSVSSDGCLSIAGVLFLLISVGPLIFLLNGGYSIVGMAWLSEHIGAYGRLFWQLAITWTVDVPVAVRAGLPLAQPVIPWMAVIGITFLEIGLLLRRMRKHRIEPLLDTTGTAVSTFDYATTAIGLAFAPWTTGLGFLRFIWVALAIGLAIPVTFGFEALIARALRGRLYVRHDYARAVGDRADHQPDRDRDARRHPVLDDDAG